MFSKAIGFKATAEDEYGNVYDAPFLITFPIMGVNISNADLQNAVNTAVSQFKYYHPRNGKITDQFEQVRNI